MALDIAIAGFSINHRNFKIVKNLDMSADLSFGVVDSSGLNHYSNRMPVTVTDSIKGLVFAGYIDQPDEQNLYPTVQNTISIHCMDYREKALKRRPTVDYAGMLAGDIVVDMHSRYLAAEGVLANYAYRNDTTQAQFATGTLSSTSATNNVGDGDLELAPAGSPLTIATNTTALWGAGTLNSVVAANNQLLLKSRNGIAISGDNNGNQGNGAYVYWQIWAGSYVIQAGDVLTYKVWVNKTSPEIRAGMDFRCTDGSVLRTFTTGGHSLGDQNGIDASPKTDLRGFADNQWYYRAIDISAMAGKTIALATIAFEGVSGGHYAAYFFDCKVTDSTGTITRVSFYNNNGSLNTSVMSQDIGYSNISVSTPLCYDTPGTRISPATSLTSVGIANTGIAAISSTIPTNTSLEIDTSFDNGATWQPATDRTAIAGLIAGAALTGISFMTRQVLTITGDDPTVTPAVSSLAANFTPSYVATKHDSFNQANTTAEWNALGTNQGGITITNQLTLSNWRRNWDDASLASQTLYGSAVPTQGPNYKRMFISTNSGTDVRSRMDFAGTYNNFTLSVDIQIPAFATDTVGVTYRTTAWGNGNNSGAWAVDISQTAIQLGYGQNNGAGTSQTYTNVASFSGGGAFAPVAGSVHTLTVIVNGSNHQVWLDGVKYIDITNATYSGNTGYVAVHANNVSGINTSYLFDNFGIGSFLTGAYETNNISLNTLATVGDSFIAWQNEPLPAGCSILVQATLDGGSTFQTCTNGAQIPGLTPGTNVVGKNLRIYISFTAPSVGYTPVLDGLLIWVTSSYSASGTRIAPALNLFNGRAGSSSLTWNDVLASGCTVGMDVSPDGTTWTDVTANNGQPLPSALIFAQPDPWLDFFSSNSSSNYTSTNYT